MTNGIDARSTSRWPRPRSLRDHTNGGTGRALTIRSTVGQDVYQRDCLVMPPTPHPLAGRALVVTGAGRGVGRGIAQACASAGAHVVVASPSENGRETVGLIEDAGGSAAWVRCDVTVRADVDVAV